MADYVTDILGRIPPDIRQLAAGAATIPSETVRFGTMLANPMRTYRQVTGTALPSDREGVIADIQGYADRYNEGVNNALGVSDPSILDDTSQAAARFLGGAIPAAPLGAASAVVSRAPAIVRGALRGIEALTPVTFTNRTGASRIAPVAANVAAPLVAGGTVEALTEQYDPTAVTTIYEPDGTRTTVYPNTTPGTGRVAARGLGAAIEQAPVETAIGAGLLAGGALLAGRGLRRTAAVRDVAGDSDIVVPEDVSPPITGADGPLQRTREITQDSAAVLKDAVKEGLPQEPGRAAQVNAFVDLTNDQAHISRVQALRSQGIVDTPGGQIRTDPIDRIAEELTFTSANNDPTLKPRVDELLSLEDELFTRKLHQDAVAEIRQKHPGTTNDELVEMGHLVRVDSNRPIYTPGTQTQAVINGKPAWEPDYITPRRTFHDVDDAKLEADTVARRTADTAPWVARYRKFHRDTLEAVTKFEAIGIAERDRFIKAHGAYRHTNNLLNPKSPFTTRLGGHLEGPNRAGDPWDAAREYADHALAFSYNNYAKRQALEALIDAKKQGINKGWIGKVKDIREIRRQNVLTTTGTSPILTRKNPDDIKLTGNVSRFKAGNDLIEVEVPNASIYNTLEVMPRHASNALTWSKGVAQSAMTGKIATLMMQPFALANMIMGAVYGMVTRPKSLPMGALDRTALAITGGRFGVRGDPTAYAGIAAQAAKNVAAVMTRAFSEAMHNSIAASGMLSKIPGAQGLATRMANAFQESMYARQFRAGAGEVSNLAGDQLDTTKRSGFTQGMEYTEQTRVVSNSDGSLKRYIQTVGKNTVPASAKVFYRLVNDIENAIANAPQSYAFASNVGRRTKGMTDAEAFREVQKLSAEVRQLLGDPAMTGTGLRYLGAKTETLPARAVGTVLSITPYANISTQAIARLMRAFREDFVGTSAAIGATLGPIVILPLVNAWRLDQDRIARGEEPIYLPWELARAKWHQARHYVIHMAGVPPEQSPAVRGDPLLAMLVAPAREAILWAAGIAGSGQYEPGRHDMPFRFLEQYAGERTRANIANSVLGALPISQFNPAITAGFAAANVELPSFTDVLARGGAQMIHGGGLGGYGEIRQNAGVMGKRLEAVLQAGLPGLGALIGGMLNQGHQSERKQPGTFVSAALREVQGRSRDRLPELNSLLWEQSNRRATTDPTSDMVNAREATLKRIGANIASIRRPGTIGSGDFIEQDTLGGGRAGVRDPIVAELIGSLHRIAPRLTPMVQERQTERERMISLSQRPELAGSFAERRLAENRVAERIVSINRRILAQFYSIEEELSQLYRRQIRIDALDPNRGIDQFPPLDQ